MCALACNKCGSLETKVCPVDEIEKAIPGLGAGNAVHGIASISQFKEILILLPELVKFLKNLFGFLEQREKNKAKVVICTKCRYWERI